MKKKRYNNLSADDIAFLLSLGHTEDDLAQLNRAINVTVYYMIRREGKGHTEEVISAKAARELLGTEQFLSSISRSAFNLTATSEVDKNKGVFFDSYRMYKRNARRIG